LGIPTLYFTILQLIGGEQKWEKRFEHMGNGLKNLRWWRMRSKLF